LTHTDLHRVTKIRVTDLRIALVAGSGSGTFSGDNGAAVDAGVVSPRSIVADFSGNLYIACHDNRVRKVAAGTAVITTFMGDGTAGAGGDGGAASSATTFWPDQL